MHRSSFTTSPVAVAYGSSPLPPAVSSGRKASLNLLNKEPQLEAVTPCATEGAAALSYFGLPIHRAPYQFLGHPLPQKKEFLPRTDGKLSPEQRLNNHGGGVTVAGGLLSDLAYNAALLRGSAKPPGSPRRLVSPRPFSRNLIIRPQEVSCKHHLPSISPLQEKGHLKAPTHKKTFLRRSAGSNDVTHIRFETPDSRGGTVGDDFHVSMPNLSQEPKNISQLLPSLQNAMAYLALTRFPTGPPNVQQGYFLPPLAPQFAGRMTLVLGEMHSCFLNEVNEIPSPYLWDTVKSQSRSANATLEKTRLAASESGYMPHLEQRRPRTLMHCAIHPLKKEPAFLVRFSDTNLLGHVYVRPYTKVFLDLASQICEIVVFTASTQSYADQVLAHLDPDRRLVHHRLYRQHCTMINGGYVKDLRLLGRDVSRVILADNSPISMALQPDNGVLVSSWTNDDRDSELMDLLVLVQHLAELENVPKYLRERYSLRAWINGHRQAVGPL
ncbi:Zgc:77714, related [Neospora caninum Liverpool]|uniref:Zgc:77714, related n=1 Tax=Neospora caninum (strain Liverpool) TaxID=572307 RepID=F0VG23_NEOCL|nr:Zgc:77714, related [Neospora caninum Liverpool]CBZ52667.1 Zgc:77714, related [Neospora caninum Liverpool]CEL66644.1 TPA: Zgc:77714, related [Neospora caninum Liverpool]|eukprot:XP_003882699.1 Zgc:77714, related [Neospora caninum Liverpool]